MAPKNTRPASAPAPVDPFAAWEGAHVEQPPIRYPWVAIDPAGRFLFPTDADADPIVSGIGQLLAPTTYGRDRKPYGAASTLRVVLLARRSRFVDAEGRAYASWEEARTAGAVVRGHTQVAAALLGCANGDAPAWKATGDDLGPVVVTLTARGVQGQAIARLLQVAAERVSAPASAELRRALPVAAFAVTLGFGEPTTVGDYGYTFHPVSVVSPSQRVREWRPAAEEAARVPGLRAAYDDALTWAGQWSPDALRASRERAAAVSDAPSSEASQAAEGDDGVPW